MSTHATIAALPNLVRVGRAAEILGLSVPTVYRLAGERKIPSLKISGALRFSETALAEYIAHAERPTAAELEHHATPAA